MRMRYVLAILSLCSLAFAGCATKPAAPSAVPDASGSSIQAEADGLAPNGNERFKSISFALLFGSREYVASWKIEIVGNRPGDPVRTIAGGATDVPDTVAWNGMTNAGALAPEGEYKARLSVDYDGRYNPGSAESKPFILAITPPSGSFSPNPARFAYPQGGVPSPIAVNIRVKPALAKTASWRIDIFDSMGGQVKSLGGALPTAQVGWDGKLDSGAYVRASTDYPAILTVSDEYGNRGTFRGSFSVADIPAPEPSSIAPRRNGFSPTSASAKSTIDLLLSVGSRSSLATWEVDIWGVVKGSPVAVKSFKDTAAKLPDYIRWDGRDDSGALAPEGSYYATFSLDYGSSYKPYSTKSKSFSVVMTPPSGTITVDPPSVSVAEIGSKKPISLTIQAKSAFAQIESWVMAVYDPSNSSVMVFNGNWPNNRVYWDGKTVSGGRLIPGGAYVVSARVTDEYGNVGELRGTISIESLSDATEPSSIEASAAGFAPTGDGTVPAMVLKPKAGDATSLVSWRIDLIDERDAVQRTISGKGASLPESVEWDGKSDAGIYAPEGIYTAALYLDYGIAFSRTIARSKPFVLDLTPPTGAIDFSTDRFSPEGDGMDDIETITLSGSSKYARLAGWTLTVLDPGNNVFVSWKGGWPIASVDWDGRGLNGDLVESASDYPLALSIRDEFGNIGVVKRTLTTGILAIKTDEGYRIRISSIVFKAFTADYEDVPPDRAARNLATLDLLAKRLAMFPDYKVKLEGHAVMINWNDKAKGDEEQRDVLIPLSQARAKAIEAALVERDIPVDRLVASGVGADNPVVPDSDYANRWKNRRVEFYLLK